MCNMIFLFCDLSECNVAIFILTKKLKARNNTNLEIEYFTFLGCFFYGIDNCK